MLFHHSESELYPAKPSETGTGFVGILDFICPSSVSVTTLGCVAVFVVSGDVAEAAGVA